MFGVVLFLRPNGSYMKNWRGLFGFLKARKRFWLTPLVILMLLAILVVFFSQSGVQSFSYSVH